MKLSFNIIMSAISTAIFTTFAGETYGSRQKTQIHSQQAVTLFMTIMLV